jgi:Flp pilus assembly protein TadG
MASHPPGERGSVTAFVAVTAVALLLVAGMAYDGGEVIAAHARARSNARKAARAAAQQIDLDELRTSGVVTIDPEAGQRAALEFLQLVGETGVARIVGATAMVTVETTQEMHILPLPSRRIAVTAAATAVEGPGP